MTGAGERALAAHNEGVRLARAGDVRAAVARLREAVALAGTGAVDPRTLKALAQLALQLPDWPLGLAAALQAAIRDPGDYLFIQKAVESLAHCPPQALSAPRFPLPAAEKLPFLSIVVVSVDDTRYEAAHAQLARAFRDWPHEFVRAKGARSMYEGYARGFAGSRGDLVIFSHDDIRIATEDFAARFAAAMEEADMLGVVGTTSLSGPALTWSGHPHLFGSIVHFDRDAADYEFAAMSLAGPVIAGAQALDGVFIAVRRPWAARVGFDAEATPGFHFYDVDFSYRAHRAGARVVIASDLGLAHLSRGSFDDGWNAAQRRFAEKFGFSMAPVAADRHFYGLRLPNLASAAAMYTKLSAVRSVTLA